MKRYDHVVLKIDPKDADKYLQLSKDIISKYKSKPFIYKIRNWK